jgi:hypothetical protein
MIRRERPLNGVEPEKSEDDIQRELLGPRGVPGAPDPAKMTPQREKKRQSISTRDTPHKRRAEIPIAILSCVTMRPIQVPWIASTVLPSTWPSARR